MRLTNTQFRRIFDDKNALMLGDRVGQHVLHGSLAGRGRACNEYVLSVPQCNCEN